MIHFSFHKKSSHYKSATGTFSIRHPWHFPSFLCQRGKCRKGRQFLDEEAQLSEVEEGVEVSSDEEDGEEQNQSLNGFVVDNTQFSQGLNGTTHFSFLFFLNWILSFWASQCDRRLSESCCDIYTLALCLFSSLSDSEMHGVYLKSVRSPAVQGKFKISNRRHHNMDIFSQVC